MHMREPRLIRKQRNRRLYDTQTRSHVTLEDLGKIIEAGESISVVDARTDEDITRSVLLQIIAEHEHPASVLLSQQFLENLVRLYANPMQGMVASYLDASLGEFNRQQGDLLEGWQRVLDDSTTAAWSETATRSIESWQRMQKELTNLWAPPAPDEEDEQNKD